MSYVGILRLLMSIVLIAVVPVQGYAAARMLACDSTRSTPHAAQGESAVSPVPMSLAMSAGMPRHHHGDTTMVVSHGDAWLLIDDGPSLSSVQDADQDPVHAPCTGCAPCCMGTALTGAFLVHEHRPTRHVGFSALPIARASAHAALPERPPRTFLD